MRLSPLSNLLSCEEIVADLRHSYTQRKEGKEGKGFGRLIAHFILFSFRALLNFGSLDSLYLSISSLFALNHDVEQFGEDGHFIRKASRF